MVSQRDASRAPDGPRPGAPPVFKLIGGRVCLDFLNTLDGARGGTTEELLTDYDRLLAFEEQAGLLERRQAASLRRAAVDHPRRAGQVLQRTLALREALYAVLAAGQAGQLPSDDDVARVNAELSAALAHARLTSASGRWEWTWEPDESALERVLWPLARDAAELLTSPDRERVRECGGNTCTWMFVDTTKNHRRRWCQMEVCGNRAKARRHRQRVRRRKK